VSKMTLAHQAPLVKSQNDDSAVPTALAHFFDGIDAYLLACEAEGVAAIVAEHTVEEAYEQQKRVSGKAAGSPE